MSQPLFSWRSCRRCGERAALVHADSGWKNLAFILALLLAVSIGDTDAAVVGRTVSDEQIVAHGQLVGNGKRVEIYSHGVKIDPSLLAIMESAYEKIETLTGLKLDAPTLGPKVRVYVSDAIAVSHVWKGYQHPSDPKGIIFLNLRAYLGAMSGGTATHVHELTHLFTWRFNSHTVREGIADYIALTIFPGAAVGPNPEGSASPPAITSEILEYLGTTKPPPYWVSADPVRRRAYYFASYRFVKYLVEMKDMETFMKLYVSENPEVAIKDLYGISREDAIQAALIGTPQ